jgi:hypothetical protein
VLAPSPPGVANLQETRAPAAQVECGSRADSLRFDKGRQHEAAQTARSPMNARIPSSNEPRRPYPPPPADAKLLDCTLRASTRRARVAHSGAKLSRGD